MWMWTLYPSFITSFTAKNHLDDGMRENMSKPVRIVKTSVAFWSDGNQQLWNYGNLTSSSFVKFIYYKETMGQTLKGLYAQSFHS